MLTPYDRNSFPYFLGRSYVVYLPSISAEAIRGTNFPARRVCRRQTSYAGGLQSRECTNAKTSIYKGMEE